MEEDRSLVPIGDTGVVMGTRGAIIPIDITFSDAESAAYALVRIGAASKWSYIDLLMTAEHLFGEASAQLLEARYAHPNSISNLRHVWRHFPTAESRGWDVSLSHYQAVAVSYLDRDIQEAILQSAEDNGLSRDEVRDMVAGYSPNPIHVPFAREAFVHQIGTLILWARDHGAPDDILNTVEPLFNEYKGKMDETWE